MTTEGMTPADYAAITGNNNNDFMGGNGAWWIIILFLFAFCGGWGNGFGGFGGGSQGAADNYVLTSDFSQLSRQISEGFGGVESGIDTIRNGLCDGFYTSAQLNAQTNSNIMQSANAIQSQLASCCCDIREGISGVNYNMAMNSNALQSAINTGFCQTNFNGQTNTRDIIDSQNANTRAILDAIQSNKVEALKDRIAEQNQMINSLQLTASQVAQNQYLVEKLNPNPCPQPAYVVQPPQTISFPNTCGVANYNGCGCA